MTKIMLVEDDNNLREIYEARLTAEGYQIVSAADGEAALALAAKERPDLLISDVMMPKISGFELLDIIRNTDSLKNMKVIMLTALGQTEDSARADALGADRYLVKSQVTLEDIIKTAHDLIQPGDNPAGIAAPAAVEPSAFSATDAVSVSAIPATADTNTPVTDDPATAADIHLPPPALPAEPITAPAMPSSANWSADSVTNTDNTSNAGAPAIEPVELPAIAVTPPPETAEASDDSAHLPPTPVTPADASGTDVASDDGLPPSFHAAQIDSPTVAPPAENPQAPPDTPTQPSIPEPDVAVEPDVAPVQQPQLEAVQLEPKPEPVAPAYIEEPAAPSEPSAIAEPSAVKQPAQNDEDTATKNTAVPDFESGENNVSAATPQNIADEAASIKAHIQDYMISGGLEVKPPATPSQPSSETATAAQAKHLAPADEPPTPPAATPVIPEPTPQPEPVQPSVPVPQPEPPVAQDEPVESPHPAEPTPPHVTDGLIAHDTQADATDDAGGVEHPLAQPPHPAATTKDKRGSTVAKKRVIHPIVDTSKPTIHQLLEREEARAAAEQAAVQNQMPQYQTQPPPPIIGGSEAEKPKVNPIAPFDPNSIAL